MKDDEEKLFPSAVEIGVDKNRFSLVRLTVFCSCFIIILQLFGEDASGYGSLQKDASCRETEALRSEKKALIYNPHPESGKVSV